MKLIVGLGNPGSKYQNNRHNAGFMFTDYLVNELTSSLVNEFRTDKYINSQLVKLEIKNQKIVIAKPLTYMNESGLSVAKLIKNLKLKINEMDSRSLR